MPRDASGNYTLPAGNPVVTGTTIDSAWANDSMDDIATELEDSLSRSGNGGMLVAFKNASGLVSAPGMSWTSETSSGFYLAGTNDMRAAIAGVDRLQFRANATDPVRVYASAAWQTLIHEASAPTCTGAWVFSGTVSIPEASVTAHEAALTILESQITDANVLARIAGNETISGNWTFGGTLSVPEAAVTAHEAALTILESQISDGSVLARVAGSETITGTWILDGPVTTSDFGTGGKVKDGGDTARPIGFNVMPVYEIDAADSFDLAHNGMLWHTDGASTIAFTCANDATIPQGATYVIVNESSAGVQTISAGAITLRWFDGSTAGGQTGTRTLASGGVATVYKYSDTEFFVWGSGLS